MLLLSQHIPHQPSFWTRSYTQFFCARRVSNLIHSRSTMSKTSLLLGEQRVDYWFDSSINKPFQDLEWDAQKSDRFIAPCIISSGFDGFLETSVKCFSRGHKNVYTPCLGSQLAIFQSLTRRFDQLSYVAVNYVI